MCDWELTRALQVQKTKLAEAGVYIYEDPTAAAEAEGADGQTVLSHIYIVIFGHRLAGNLLCQAEPKPPKRLTAAS